MVTAYRLVKQRHADTAFDGEGASRYGGRWNSKGVRMVYVSQTRSLAALEVLARIDRTVPVAWVTIPCAIPEALIEALAPKDLPSDWRSEPAPTSTRLLGDAWVRRASRPALRVPSVLVPAESNFLLNPLHPDFANLVIHPPEPFAFDPRLNPTG